MFVSGEEGEGWFGMLKGWAAAVEVAGGGVLGEGLEEAALSGEIG